jgi:branched-chain amino acid transport system permease protein
MVPRLRSLAVLAASAAVTALAYVVVVHALGQDYNLKNLSLAGAFAVATLGLSLLLGITHQFSLGQAFFFGLGAYVYAVLSGDPYGWPTLTAAIVAIVASAAVAYVIGRILLRLEGFHFAVATLGMGLIGENVLFAIRRLTGGDDGKVAMPLEAFGYRFDSEFRQFVLVAACVAIAFTVAVNLSRSRRGRAARAVGLDELMAQANGIDVASAKTQMFVVSAVYAGVGGILYAAASGYVFPNIAGVGTTLELVVAVIVGGMGSLVGPVLAIVFLRWLPVLFESIEEHVALVYGVSLVVLLVVLPERQRTRPPLVRRVWRRARERSTAAAVGAVAAEREEQPA